MFSKKRIVSVCGYRCAFTENNTKIYNSYNLKSNKEIKILVENIMVKRQELKLNTSRTKNSYIREVKAHIRLYKFGLFKSHTKDTDLEEPILKRINFIYFIIGL